MVYLVIRIGNPGWPSAVPHLVWLPLIFLFQFPGILVLLPPWIFLFMRSGASNFPDGPPDWHPDWMVDMCAGAVWALFLYGILSFYYRIPPHWAAGSNQNPGVIAALLDAGADPSARDKDGKTPLHDAARSNQNPDVIAALLDAGADPSARDKDGKTPLHDAARSNQNPDVIAALLDAGADPSARDEDGRTPWDFAKDRERIKGSDAYRRLNDAQF